MRTNSTSLAKLTLIAALAAPLALAVACGDDSDGGGNGGGGGGSVFQSPQEDETKLSELSQDDINALCDSYVEYYTSRVSDDDLKKIGCYAFSAIFTTDENGNLDAATCNQAAQACLADDEGFEPDGDPAEECRMADFAGCDATIEELEACYTATVQALDSLAPRITCQTFSDPSALESLSNPAACAAIEMKCPELFEDDGGENNTNFDSSASVTVDGQLFDEPNWSSSGSGGNLLISFTLDGGDSLEFDFSLPAVPVTLDMTQAVDGGAATVTLVWQGTTYVNMAGDSATGTLSLDDSEELGPQLTFEGEVMDANGSGLSVSVAFDGF